MNNFLIAVLDLIFIGWLHDTYFCLQDYCHQFMSLFQDTFGVEHMKFSVHLVSHLHLALQYFGPLSNMACYGPENEIGRITRNVLSMYNTTKHVMNNYVILNQASLLLADIAEGSTQETNVKLVNGMRIIFTIER